MEFPFYYPLSSPLLWSVDNEFTMERHFTLVNRTYFQRYKRIIANFVLKIARLLIFI